MSLQDEWCHLVDEVAAIDSTDPLPREYAPMEFLPGGHEISNRLLEHIRAASVKFEAESRGVFQPQMTAEEGYHAAPVVTRDNAFSFSSLLSVSHDGNGVQKNNNDTDKKLHVLGHEGPNFYEAHRRHTSSAKGKHDPMLLSGFGTLPGSGVIRSLGSTSRLASGFMLPEYYSQKHRRLDFIPIIFVSASVSSLLQLINIRAFLEKGVYVDPPSLFMDAETGAVNIKESKPDAVIVNPGSLLDADKYTVAYKMFRVVDDPKQVKNWQHVCACIVDGNEWQFRGWYPNESKPLLVSELFQRLCGFLPYLEEEKLPKALYEWHVKPLVLTRRLVKSHTHILQASIFWEHLYTFLETHPFFKLFTVPNE